MENIENIINKLFKDKFNEEDEFQNVMDKRLVIAVALIIAEKYKEIWSDPTEFSKYIADLYVKNVEKIFSIIETGKVSINDKDVEWLWIAMWLLKICTKRLRDDNVI